MSTFYLLFLLTFWNESGIIELRINLSERVDNMKTGRPGKMVMCVNDGRIFKSMQEAAQHYDTTRSTISRNISGELKTAKRRKFIMISGLETEDELAEIRKNIISELYEVTL